jgi:SAM-dependent methyltransferase
MAGELPYPDASVDRVLSSLMFHHLDEDEKARALAEVRRVLTPDGSLHLADFGGHHGPLVRRLFRNNPHVRGNEGDAIPQAMRAAGFADVVTTDRRAGMTYIRAPR